MASESSETPFCLGFSRLSGEQVFPMASESSETPFCLGFSRLPGERVRPESRNQETDSCYIQFLINSCMVNGNRTFLLYCLQTVD